MKDIRSGKLKVDGSQKITDEQRRTILRNQMLPTRGEVE